MLQNLRGPELLIILLIIVLLFGAKKLPDTARGLGRSLRIFKAETRGLNDEDRDAAKPAPEISAGPSSTPTQQTHPKDEPTAERPER